MSYEFYIETVYIYIYIVVFCVYLLCNGVFFFSSTGVPGVLFVLPDSYVDPENKDYGGKIGSLISLQCLLSLF